MKQWSSEAMKQRIKDPGNQWNNIPAKHWIKNLSRQEAPNTVGSIHIAEVDDHGGDDDDDVAAEDAVKADDVKDDDAKGEEDSDVEN